MLFPDTEKKRLKEQLEVLLAYKGLREDIAQQFEVVLSELTPEQENLMLAPDVAYTFGDVMFSCNVAPVLKKDDLDQDILEWDVGDWRCWYRAHPENWAGMHCGFSCCSVKAMRATGGHKRLDQLLSFISHAERHRRNS